MSLLESLGRRAPASGESGERSKIIIALPYGLAMALWLFWRVLSLDAPSRLNEARRRMLDCEFSTRQYEGGVSPRVQHDLSESANFPVPAVSSSEMKQSAPAIAAWLLWPLIISLPLILTHNDLYKKVFKPEWYAYSPYETPSPLGLSLGILAVIVGQVFILIYHWHHVNGYFGSPKPIQTQGPAKHKFISAMLEHLSQPEGFVMLGAYLAGYWMSNRMPDSYYSFSGGIDWIAVAKQLLIQDTIQALMHFGEHKISAWFYRHSHKPHHRFTNPKLFDAFNGSWMDTLFMILIPLYITSNCVSANVWTYMTFGSLYANWLCLIHSETDHPWDGLFRKLGFGTAADHHVHHKVFIKNYGHLFMYTDFALSTYLNPKSVDTFNPLP